MALCFDTLDDEEFFAAPAIEDEIEDLADAAIAAIDDADGHANHGLGDTNKVLDIDDIILQDDDEQLLPPLEDIERMTKGVL